MRPDAPLKRARYGMRFCGVCLRGQRGSQVMRQLWSLAACHVTRHTRPVIKSFADRRT